MFKQLVRHRPLLALGATRAVSAHQLRVPGAHTLVSVMARAPCLNCGRSTGLPHSADMSQVLAARVDCGASQLPLACSTECAEELEKAQPQLLKVFDSMVEDVEFAATPEASQLFAEVLQPSRRESSHGGHLTSWMKYLQLYHPSDRWLQDARALRLLSSAYSYVLTLSRFLPELVETDANKLELHVIGARAEAMMPRYLWDELSFFHPDRQFAIKLVGDHVPILPKRMQTTGNSDENSAIQLENINGLYHTLKPDKVGTPDAFVLYNPGVGHSHLRESWRPTIEAVLASCKPVLITSFSVEDQQRDVAALQELVASGSLLKHHELRFRCRAKQNSFGSLKYQVDPANGTPIQTNNRVMVVQLAAVGDIQSTSS